MTPAPLAITACRLLTPLDRPQNSTWQSIRANQKITQTVSVADHLLDADETLDRSIRLALAVTKNLPDLAADSLFCGTSKGPVTTMLNVLHNPHAITLAQARHVELGVGAMASVLRERLKIAGPAHTSVAACSSGLHALHRAASAIRRGECGRALVVAADASLHPLFEASFQRLGVLSPRDADGNRRCEPFSASGAGFFLIEAAAALVLESPSAASNPAIAYLEDSWIGGDSTGLIAIDPDSQALATGLRAMKPDKLAFVHAHATGTAHDGYELAAIRSTCGQSVPVFSHKKWLGHSLGAAGLVSACLSIQCHQHGQTLDGTRINPSDSSLTIAQGFGGHIGLIRLRGA